MQLTIIFDPAFRFFFKHHTDDMTVICNLDRRASAKDIIESYGIPHTEVGRIRYNGESVDFAFIPEKTGNLVVSAIIPPFDVLSASDLRPEPFVQIRFVADVNVIRLGRLMILLGFDVCYASHFTDEMIAGIAFDQKRIVLTRDTRLLNRKKIVFARRIREGLPYRQLVEVITFFGLENQISYFSRCTICNQVLESVDKENIIDLLEPKTRKYFNTFFKCPCCKKIYWKGSHYDHIRLTFKRLGLSV